MCQQSWTWTREIGPLKAAACLALLLLAVVSLASQDFNPFIYFLF